MQPERQTRRSERRRGDEISGLAEVNGAEFIGWADRYLAIDDVLGPQPTGNDYWGARCGILHTYASVSRKSRRGQARHIFYKYRVGGPSVWFGPVPEHKELEGGCFVVDIEALVTAFFRGVDRFLTEVLGDPARGPLAEIRFRKMYNFYPAPPRST